MSASASRLSEALAGGYRIEREVGTGGMAAMMRNGQIGPEI